MDPEVLRGIERLAVVVVGGMSVYLGYRLFLNLPEQKDSEGHLNLPGDISIYFSRVGPGIFFALFGSLIVAASLYFAVTIYDRDTGNIIQRGAGPESQSGQVFEQQPINEANLKGDITLLNRVENEFSTNTPIEYRSDWDRALPRIKLSLLRTVWQSDWGDYGHFESVILDGDGERRKTLHVTPLKLYEAGTI